MRPLPPSDEALLQRISRGDAEAFQILLERHANLAYGLSRRILGNTADAEDACQEAWTDVLKDSGAFDPRGAGSGRAWIARIVLRSAQDVSRKRRPTPEDAVRPDPSPSSSPEETREIQRLVEMEVRALPDGVREAVLLHYYHGMTQRDVAAVLDRPEGTVRRQVVEAVETLRHRLLRREVVLPVVALAAAMQTSPAYAAPAALKTSLAMLPSQIAPVLAPATSVTKASLIGGGLMNAKAVLAVLIAAAVSVGLVARQMSTSQTVPAPVRAIVPKATPKLHLTQAPLSETPGTPKTEPPGLQSPLPPLSPAPRLWRDRLAVLSPKGFDPEKIDKLASILDAHPGDPAWEAGVLNYLARGLAREERLDFWKAAAETLPENLPVSDILLRISLDCNPHRLGEVLQGELLKRPENTRLLWLSASMAAKEGRLDEAERLILIAGRKPQWAEQAGIPEIWSVKVEKTMLEGTPETFSILRQAQEAFDHESGILQPDLKHYQNSSKALIDLAETRRSQGDLEGARALLEANARLGSAMSEGSRRTLISYLVGMAVERRATQRLRDMAADLLTIRAAESRLHVLKEESDRTRLWLRETTHDLCRLDAFLGNRYVDYLRELGIPSSPAPDTPDLEVASRNLAQEDRALVERMTREILESSEMDRYRAWKAAQAGAKP